MKPRFAFLCLAVALAWLPASALGQSDGQPERIAASFMLALGRAPTAAEAAQWAAHGTLSVSDLVARHRAQLQADAPLRRATLLKSFHDAFGRAPTGAELDAASGDDGTYTELMKRHLRWLAEHPEDYAQVLERAYQLVVRRGVYPEEIDYWKKQDTLSYALLVGCVEDWARRNQPGLMITAGTATVSVNCVYLATVRLSPAIAAEARAAAGLAPAGDGSRQLVAPGADRIASSGRIHFVAAGSVHLQPR